MGCKKNTVLYTLGTMSSTTETTAAPTTAKTDAFAVIETGGKQYIVAPGDVLEVELLSEYNEGDAIVFDKVLLHDTGTETKVGTPYVSGAKVTATCTGDTKGKKISIIRYKAKSNRSRKVGHRQTYTKVTIDKIS